MTTTTSTITTTPTTVTPKAVHESWLQILLQILSIGVAVAPIAAAPFLGPGSASILSTESQVASGVLSAIEQSEAPPAAS